MRVDVARRKLQLWGAPIAAGASRKIYQCLEKQKPRKNREGKHYVSYHIISYHVMSCHIISYHIIISYYDYILLCTIMYYNVLLCTIIVLAILTVAAEY